MGKKIGLFAFVWLCILFFQKKLKAQDAPNIVLILMDDMGYGDPTTFGSPVNQTPNLDKLAATGARLTNFYAAQGVCSATRAAVMTGCYPTRVSISGALFPDAAVGLNPEEETIAELLKKKGYNTAMVGKWHLGHLPQFLPVNQGFDQYFGIPYSNDMWPVDFDGNPVDTSHRKTRFPVLPVLRNTKVDREIRTLEDQGMITQWYTHEALQFINQQSKDKPFFLYLAHSMPHVPINASPKFLNSTGKGLYADVIAELDWSVGAVMDALKQNDLADNTLFIVTSDNGPWLTFGNHSGNSGGLREGKGTAWEGGVRVPCYMVWPQKIEAGTVLNGIAAVMDLLPTIANAAMAPLPEKKIDGYSLHDYLLGKQKDSPRKAFAYYYDRNNLKAVRHEEWKLVFEARSQTYMSYAPGMDGHPGGYADTLVQKALYNLNLDPGETRDLQKKFPDKVKQLEAIADQFRRTIGDGIQNTTGTEVRPIGKKN